MAQIAPEHGQQEPMTDMSLLRGRHGFCHIKHILGLQEYRAPRSVTEHKEAVVVQTYQAEAGSTWSQRLTAAIPTLPEDRDCAGHVCERS